MKTTFLRALLALAVSVAGITGLSANRAPTAKEIKNLKERGIYQERLKLVESMQNGSFSSSVFERAKGKLRRAHLQAQGLSAEEIEEREGSESVPPDWEGMPTTGNPRVPTILIDFPDQRAPNLFPDVAPSDIYENIYGYGTAAAQSHMPFNSVADYYRRASHEKLEIKGNVLGFHTMPNNQLTYAPLSAGGDNQILFDIITEAMRAFDNTHDFSQYDNNNDGYIDGINVIYVGQQGAWSSFWWAYRWRFFVPDVESTFFDGKKLSWFTWQKLDTREGGTDFDPQTLTHETGHMLGLPDLYDYKRGQGMEGGVGGLDLMDSNQGSPNAFFRWMMDWITPEIVSAGAPATRSLSAAGDTATDQNKCVVIFPDVTNSPFQEFFMVENRHRVGNDGGKSFMPSNGLVVWHVDGTLNAAGSDFAFNNNDIPAPTAHKLVKLMQADGLEQVEIGGRADAGDYYNSGESLTPATSPDTRSYASQNTEISIANISPDGLLMTAEIGFLGQGGQPDLLDGGEGSHGLSDATRDPGQSLTITGRVENAGAAASGGFTVNFYASTDPNITTGDTLLGQRSVGALDAGASTALNHAVTVPSMPARTYHVGWILDSTGAVSETNESNNTVVIAPQLTVSGTVMPDLNVRGAGIVIANGDGSPRPQDGTDFGSTLVGSETRHSFALANDGSAPLTGVSVAVSGADAAHFAVVTPAPATINAGGAGAVLIGFSPQSAGAKMATMSVSSNDPDTPTYTFSIQGNGLSTSDDHGNTTATATDLSAPAVRSGILEVGGDEDFFRFTLSERGTVTVFTTGGTDTFGKLLGSDGSIIQESDDDGDGLNFSVTSVLDPGTWFIRVAGYDNSVAGPYEINLNFSAGATDDHGDTFAAATAATLGTTVSGSIESPGDTDMFVVILPAAGILRFESQGTTDTFGRAFDGSQTEIGSDDDGGIDRNFLLSGSLAAGTYYLAVTGYDGSTTGPYSVSVSFTEEVLTDDHGDDVFSATQVYPSGVTLGALESGGDVDVFAVTFFAPGLFTFYTAGDTDTYGSADTLFDDDEGPLSNFSIEATIPAAGTYYLAVEGFDETEVGEYMLFTHFVPWTQLLDDHRNVPDDTFSMLVGTNSSTSGMLELAADVDYFRIAVPQAGVLTVSTSGTTDTFGFLHEPNGIAVASSDDDGAGSNFEIVRPVSAGTYFVRVEGYELTATGFYTLEVSFLPGSLTDDHGDTLATATTVGPNSDTAGSLEIGGDEDFFSFTLSESLEVTVATTGATDTFGTLFRADGSEIVSNDDASATDLNCFLGAILPAGSYGVRVRGFSEEVTGEYTLEVRATTIEPAGDLRITGFEVLSPTSVRLTFEGAPGFTYHIQKSTNLVSWTTVVPNITGSGTIQRTVPISPAETQAFFQIQRD